MIIDAHLHLWKVQNGVVDGKRVYGIGDGISNFGGELRQMMPPYILNNENTAEILISNMNYACVSGAVVTQEYIDGNQDKYLLKAKQKYQNRLKICSLYEERQDFLTDGFDGVKICAGRLKNQDLTAIAEVFKRIESENKFLSIDLAEGDIQTGSMQEMIDYCPSLKIAIGHFGMVTTKKWQEQIRLARNRNVFIESGGITWLFNNEFYPYRGAVTAIKEAAEISGIEKLMWGSDYPRTMTAITYKMSFDFVSKSKELNEREKVLFLGETACKFYEFEKLPQLGYVKNMVE